MKALGFWTIVSNPIWMVFICVYAGANRTETARGLWWAAVIIFVSGWAIYGLPDTVGELYVVGLATFVSVPTAIWGIYVINTQPSKEDALLNVAEAIARLGLQSPDVETTTSRNGKAARDDG
jgi:hypothetical protein